MFGTFPSCGHANWYEGEMLFFHFTVIGIVNGSIPEQKRQLLVRLSHSGTQVCEFWDF